MRLTKREHSRYKGKTYYKYEVTIPSEIVDELGWKEGQEIQPEIRRRKLVLEPV